MTIGIIALLISLLTGGVIFAFNKVDQVKTQREISGLAASLRQFEVDFNVGVPPPSRLWLDNSATPYSTPPTGFTAAQVQQLGVDSQAYLRKVWPRISFGPSIDWASSGKNPPTTFNGILEGEEVLVLVLGGARDPNSGAFVGFSTNPANPMDTSNINKRKGPYYTFDLTRVRPVNGQPAPTTNKFPAYNDPYGVPYAYFSSGKATNSYEAYFAALKTHDCNSLSATLVPYFNGNQFYNADTFQIISAGKNQAFGNGGQWTPQSGPAGTGAGADDLSNFYEARLGVTP